MKTICFLTFAAALGLSLSSPAQQPGPDQDRPKDPPPPSASRPDQKPDVQHREPGRGPHHGPGPQARAQDPAQGRHQPSVSGGDREVHLREAMRHLREAGLGDMADRLEHAIKARGHGHRGPQRDMAHGRHMSPEKKDDDTKAPQRRPQWSDQTRRDSGAFAMPQRVPNPRHHSRRGPDQRREGSAAGTEELRSQVQRLAREVEQLKELMKHRAPENPREQVRRPDEPRREERRDSPASPPREERRDD